MELQYKKILAKQLVFSCPMGMALNNCLTRNLRKLPLKERLNIIEELGSDEIDFLLTNHRDCRQKREKTRLQYTGQNTTD
jgi:hypothetical protein